MADDDPTAGVDATDVGAVADVLYRLAPDRFIATRTAFVKAAKAAGGKDVARDIQGFGRPTKAAWVLNVLARDAPEVVEQLVELGRSLTEAQADLDATSLRELTDQRRALVRDVSKQAFTLAAEPSPSQPLAIEVQDTLTAAVVDPAVGEALQAGALLKAAQASGFGPSGPELASVPPPRKLRAVPTPAPAAKQATPEMKPTPAEKRAAEKARRAEEKAAAEAERVAAEKRERIKAADRALTAAKSDLDTARQAEKDAEEQVRILREQVRDADRALGDAGLAVREARAAVRAAEKARRDAR